jgi:serine protease Do
MQAQHETLLIVAVASGIFFGSIAGGLTAVVAVETMESANTVNIEGLTPNEEAAIAGLLEEEEATIAVVDQVTPVVVSIVVEQEDEVSLDYYPVASGTGFFVSADGLILTNKHVVNNGGDRFTVVTSDGVEYPAEVLARDVFLDLAVMKITPGEGMAFPAANLGDSSGVRVGETVIAIGNPLGEFPNSVTKGIVSGLNRTITAGSFIGDTELIEEAIQTDAAINEGNSGGPLINLQGEVIGVNSAIAWEGQSIGFSIPINVAKKVVDDVIAYGRIVRPWLGVRYVMVDESVVEEFGLAVDAGALIIPEEPGAESVIPGSPAAAAELQPGDVILSVDGVSLSVESSLGDVINTFAPGTTVTLRVHRAGEVISIPVTLVELDPAQFER